MPDIFCNTSPLQYLHQLDLLHILPSLVEAVVVPPAVVEELEQGRQNAVNLPLLDSLSWVSVRPPQSLSALPLVHELGAGEAEVLMLVLETPGSSVIWTTAWHGEQHPL